MRKVSLFDFFLTQLICQPTVLSLASSSLPLVSIYEHTYGADIARMTFGDEMSLESPTFPFLRFLIGPFFFFFFAILVYSLRVTVTCSPPSYSGHSASARPEQTCTRHKTSNIHILKINTHTFFYLGGQTVTTHAARTRAVKHPITNLPQSQLPVR